MPNVFDQFDKPSPNIFDKFDEASAPNRMAFAPSDLASNAPPPSTGSDILHSFGTGLAKGGIGLSTMAGNLEQLGRVGFNKAFDIGTKLALGQNADVPSPISNQTFFPTAGEVTNKLERDYGKFYEPQTIPGQYAQTAGEFAPGALAGGPETSLLARALNVAVPAATSETAGQLTAGTPLEPYARTAGALVSGKLPNVATVPGRIVTPLTAEATRLEHVANLENQGITALSAGERTGNTGLRFAESEAANGLIGGAGARELEKLKGQQATKAAWSHASIDASDVKPETINDAQEHLGNMRDLLASQSNFMVSTRLVNDLKRIGREFEHDLPSESLRSPLVTNIIKDIEDKQGTLLSGDQYGNLRSRIGKAMANARNSNNGHLANGLGDIQEALDDAMARAAPPQVAKGWMDFRRYWRNFLAIQDAAGRAGEKTANGTLSMPALAAALRKQEGKNYAGSTRPLVQLARSAEGVMKPLPDSGTAARLGWRRFVSGTGAATGAALGASVGAGLPGAGVGAIAGALAPTAFEGLANWGLTNPLTQGYLGNQRMTTPLAAYQASQSVPWWYLPQGLSPAAEAEAAAAKKKKGTP